LAGALADCLAVGPGPAAGAPGSDAGGEAAAEDEEAATAFLAVVEAVGSESTNWRFAMVVVGGFVREIDGESGKLKKEERGEGVAKCRNRGKRTDQRRKGKART
jgi:hypothetical protein